MLLWPLATRSHHDYGTVIIREGEGHSLEGIPCWYCTSLLSLVCGGVRPLDVRMPSIVTAKGVSRIEWQVSVSLACHNMP